LKQSINDLALFGGTPTFDTHLHVGRPNIGERAHFVEQVNDILDRGWLTNDGSTVQAFERKVAERLGVKHCLAVCNGTIGMQLAAAATGLKGEVILPSFTFIATAHALQWQGLRPVFCDVRPDTHTIDPTRIEALITGETCAIVGVQLWGQACDVEALQDIAQRHNLVLLYDAAHAFMCSARGVPIGNFGDAEILSFHATKFFNTFEGGAIVTNDDHLARQVCILRNFGFGGKSYDDIEGPGINGKMSEISAAMGLTNLESVDDFIRANRANYQHYHRQLEGVRGMKLLTYDPGEMNNYQYVVGEIDHEIAGIHRDVVLEILHAENVIARRYFYPGCHKVEPYRSTGGNIDQRLPVTNRLAQQVIVLPMGGEITAGQIEKVSALIRFAIENAEAIQARRDKV
jgi:dTDP-4-amino-4,6-dideoxygalactose transaminase